MQIVSDPQFDPESDPADPMLDQLLAQARWPEPTADSARRIKSRWNAIARRHRMTPALWCVVYAAAAVIAVFFGSQLLALREQLVNPQLVDLPVGSRVNYLSVAKESSDEASIVSRPANLVERMTLLQGSASSAPNAVSLLAVAPVLSSNNDANDAGDSAELAQLLKQVADPDTQLAALGKLKEMSDPPVRPLMDRLTSPSLDERFAAATALATLDDPRVVEMLVQRAQRNPGQREALVALGLSGSPLAKKALAAMELSSAARAQLLADRKQLLEQSQVFTPRS